MKINFTHHLIAVVVALSLTASCATYLNSGQWANDSLVPTPLSPTADRANATMLFANGSFASDFALIRADYNQFVQAGLLQSWRRPLGDFSADGHFALSGWYGEVQLSSIDDSSTTRSIPSTNNPFSFYGASAQAGESLGFRTQAHELIELGFRGGAGYEDGAYRAFRAAAATASPDIIDECTSGWTGTLGGELAITGLIGTETICRVGLFSGVVISDLVTQFLDPADAVKTYLIQPSLAIRDGSFSCAFAFNWTLLNSGTSLTIGYVF
jgi:hypothetical protein